MNKSSFLFEIVRIMELIQTVILQEKKRKEKEEALRMLSELKKVISVRAIDTEKREKAAILKMYPDLHLAENFEESKLSNQEVSNILKPHSSSNQRTLKMSCDQSGAAEQISQGVESDNEYDAIVTSPLEITNDNEEPSLDQELKEFERKTDEFHHTYEQINERDKHSVISSQGVRRLRKSDMLDVSDSDSEGYPDDKDKDEHYGDEDDDEEVDNLPRLGLPLIDLTKKGELGEQGEQNLGPSSKEATKFRLPLLTLEERLEQFSRANYGLTSELAEKAVAKSKTMGVMEETTSGGDVYGECSSSNDDDDDDDDDDVVEEEDGDDGRTDGFKER